MDNRSYTGSSAAKSAKRMHIFYMVEAEEVAYSTDRNWRLGYEKRQFYFSLDYF